MSIDVLAVGAHPDDVDLSVGGTVAKLAGLGRSVIILDLTRGEMGSRGSAEVRAEEAQRAAEILGVAERRTLDLGDGMLENNAENRRPVIEIIRDLRPKLVLGPYWEDLHPDHAAAGGILRSVMYPSGFSKYPAGGEPYRPNEYLFFMAHTPFEPSLIIDITDSHEKKIEALRCFSSQLHSGENDEPATIISQPSFIERLEGRARYFGSLIDRVFGEPFFTCRPVPMADPVGHYELFPDVQFERVNKQ